jgi:cytochrome c peroxidase
MVRSLFSSCACVGFVLTAAAAGCGGNPTSTPTSTETTESTASALSLASILDVAAGQDLFFNATFRGNGRTCGTCHTSETGTISPEQIRTLARTDPHNPIFRSIDSDDGVGNSYTRLKTNATIRITLDLPPSIRLHDHPTQKTFTVFRSTPTFINSSLFPRTDPTGGNLMWDGRDANLQSQALDAVHSHDQNRIEPTARELDLIADFESVRFSSLQVDRFAHGGPAPVLPAGYTASEKRGRAFFNPGGACASCHSGPMLNQALADNPTGVPAGQEFNTVFAGFEGGLGFPQPSDSPNPVLVWDMDCTADGFFCNTCPFFGGTLVNDTDGTDGYCTIPLPDPGEAIPKANSDFFLFFKTPSLWGVKNTAPYFHDNSAATLADVMSHYDKFLSAFTGTGLTAQDQADLVNYLNLL